MARNNQSGVIHFKGIVSILIFSASIVYLGFVPQQSDFLIILSGFTLAFVVYFYWIHTNFKILGLKTFLILAIILRIILIFSFPNLSDDIYRFIWDGRLLVNGTNPYALLPSEIINSTNIPAGIDPGLFAKLNSPNYFTIYPPLCQVVFAVPAFLGIKSLLWNSAIIKLLLFTAEIGSITLIIRLLKIQNIMETHVLIYALNPLILIEIMGNLHFEGLMIFFFLWFCYLFFNIKYQLSALAFSLSVASKLVPFIFLPFTFPIIGKHKSFRYLSLVTLIVIFLFIPILMGFNFTNFGESLDLYFRKFEFNASIYYVLRAVGYYFVGYNLIQYIGPGLSLISFILILSIVYRKRREISYQNFFSYCLFAFTIYLLFSTTIHPWYLAFPILFCVFTPFRYPLIWSAVIPVTYFTYQAIPYQESLWLVTIEYFVVSVWILMKEKSLTSFLYFRK